MQKIELYRVIQEGEVIPNLAFFLNTKKQKVFTPFVGEKFDSKKSGPMFVEIQMNRDLDAGAKAICDTPKATGETGAELWDWTVRCAQSCVLAAVPQLVAETESLKAKADNLENLNETLKQRIIDANERLNAGDTKLAAVKREFSKLDATQKGHIVELTESLSKAVRERDYAHKHLFILAKTLKLDGMTWSFLVSETASLIERLRKEVDRLKTELSDAKDAVDTRVPFSLDRWNAGEREVTYRNGEKPYVVGVIEGFEHPVRSKITEDRSEIKHIADGVHHDKRSAGPYDLMMPAVPVAMKTIHACVKATPDEDGHYFVRVATENKQEAVDWMKGCPENVFVSFEMEVKK